MIHRWVQCTLKDRINACTCNINIQPSQTIWTQIFRKTLVESDADAGTLVNLVYATVYILM